MIIITKSCGFQTFEASNLPRLRYYAEPNNKPSGLSR